MAVPTIQEQLRKMQKDIEKKLGEKGLEKVAKTIIEEGKEQVDKVVYEAYTPRMYERTGQLREQWGIMWTEPLIIGVYNNRWDEGVYIPEIIISGEGYSIKGNPPYGYERPRPFIKATIEELERSKAHVKAFKESLEDVGYKVRIK